MTQNLLPWRSEALADLTWSRRYRRFTSPFTFRIERQVASLSQASETPPEINFG